MEANQEIARECCEVYAEIHDLQKHFRWTQKELCEKASVEIFNDGCSNEKEKTRKLQERVKKMFQRKTWEQDKATPKTLDELKQLRAAIYRTDDYKDSDLNESLLSPSIRKFMDKQSKELKQHLQQNDFEE